jgi:hypothetical protein
MRALTAVIVVVLIAAASAGCSFTVTKHDVPDYNGDGRIGFNDLESDRSDVAYEVASDTRTPEQRLEDHMSRQKGGSEYERERDERRR